jgi:2-polyprenyl-6-methoxyphenol hydroxylase-like FAD-dependent oxidoreductase
MGAIRPVQARECQRFCASSRASGGAKGKDATEQWLSVSQAFSTGSNMRDADYYGGLATGVFMKIAISGAGVAGPALAYWLLRTGHAPTLIETASAFRSGGYIVDFWGNGYNVAERMGLLPQIQAAGYQVQGVRLVDTHGRRQGGFNVDVFRRMLNSRFTSLPRGDLALQIFRAIADRAETRFGTSIAAMEEHDRGVHLTLDNGEEQDFDLVIGADGLHSRVRTLAFGPEEQFERRLDYFVAAFETEGYRPRDELVYVSCGMPGLQVSRFALRGDRTMFLLVFAAEHLKGAEPHSLQARKETLDRVFGQMGWEWPAIARALDKASEVYFDPVSQIAMDRWSKGRTCLIGDAAACVSLLAGEGTGLAMVEAYVLAGELHRARGDYRAAFADYERRLRPLLARKQSSARNFAGAFAPRTRFGLWFRNKMTKLMAIPPIATALIGADLRDNFEPPDYDI